MIITSNKQELDGAVNSIGISFEQLGFVPTMGALHKGHLELITKAKLENKAVVCSIFVNPTQFNNKTDLANYPRTIEDDIQLLERAGCDFLFLPTVVEMYPDGENLLDVDLNGLDKLMEGLYRPGHFSGMITIVDKLLRLVNAANNYFGEKDFQQLAIIRYYVSKMNLPFKIIGCKTVREDDGLAFSSRNVLLSPDERVLAPVIFRTLNQCMSLKNVKSVEALKKWATEQIDNTMLLKTEYLSFIDSKTLLDLNNWNDSAEPRACIAVLSKSTRLIDNIAL